MVFSLRSIPIIGTIQNFAQMAAIAAVVGAVAFGVGYYKGGSNARQEARIKELQDNLAAERTRNEIDNETEALGAYELCIGLGGLPDECRLAVRGLEADQQSGEPGATRSQ